MALATRPVIERAGVGDEVRQAMTAVVREANEDPERLPGPRPVCRARASCLLTPLHGLVYRGAPIRGRETATLGSGAGRALARPARCACYRGCTSKRRAVAV